MTRASLRERRSQHSRQRTSRRSLFQSLGESAPKLVVAKGRMGQHGDSYFRSLPFIRSRPALFIACIFLLIVAIPLVSVVESGMARSNGDLFSFSFSLFTIFWMLGWSVGIAIFALIILLVAVGREVVLVREGDLFIYFGLPFLAIGGQYSGALLRHFRQEEAVTESGSDRHSENKNESESESETEKRIEIGNDSGGEQAKGNADKRENNRSGHKWRGDHLAFDYAGYPIRFGSAITDVEADEIITALQAQFPNHADPLPADIQSINTMAAERDSEDVLTQKSEASRGSASVQEAARPGPGLRSRSALALIAANLIPVFGVLFLDWQIMQVMLLFWAESAVIGFYNVVKMVKIAGLLAIFYGLFFIGHYGAFMAGHLLFIYALFGDAAAGNENSQMTQVLTDFLYLAPAVAGFFISHGVSYFSNFLGRSEHQGRGLNKQMGQPYKRIIVMHITIILGGFMVAALDSTLPALLLLVVLKLAADLHSHLKEHGEVATD